MKKSEILQMVLTKLLNDLVALKTVLREDEFEHVMYKFGTFEEYMKGKIVFEKVQEKNEEAE